jgi:hypothetical protein
MVQRMVNVHRSGKLGRPWKGESGHSPGTGGVRTRTNQGPDSRALDSSTSVRRLLGLETTAVYGGYSALRLPLPISVCPRGLSGTWKRRVS